MQSLRPASCPPPAPPEPEVTLSVSIPAAPPLRSQLGGALVLPCYFLDSSVLTPAPHAPLSYCIKWTHVTSNRVSVVLVATGGSVRVAPEYVGRVSMVSYPLVPTDGSVTITGLRSGDAGTYRCEVTHGFRNAQDSVDAEVQGENAGWRPPQLRLHYCMLMVLSNCIQGPFTC